MGRYGETISSAVETESSGLFATTKSTCSPWQQCGLQAYGRLSNVDAMSISSHNLESIAESRPQLPTLSQAMLQHPRILGSMLLTAEQPIIYRVVSRQHLSVATEQSSNTYKIDTVTVN